MKLQRWYSEEHRLYPAGGVFPVGVGVGVGVSLGVCVGVGVGVGADVGADAAFTKQVFHTSDNGLPNVLLLQATPLVNVRGAVQVERAPYTTEAVPLKLHCLS